MKWRFWVMLASLFGGSNGMAQTTSPPWLSLDIPTITERGPHHRVWSTLKQHPETGEWATNRFVELATGLCYEQNGIWTDSEEIVEAFAEGAIARRLPHKMIFASNLNSAGAIDLLTPEGQRFRSAPLGLAYYDPASGKSVWIGGLQDCQGEILPPNQVIYRNAFSNINCVVRYTVTKGGMEQDIILLERPPVGPEDLGLSEYTRLEVVTEFLDNPPARLKSRVIKTYPQIPGQPPMVEAEFVDEELSFGGMRTGPGKAFKLNGQEDEDPGVEVSKRLGTANGRAFLIEGIEYQAIRSRLSALPQSKSGVRTAMHLPVTPGRTYPSARRPIQDKQPLLMARNDLGSEHGLVIDYQGLLTQQSDMVLQADTTYYVSGTVTLSNLVVEGCAVVKFTNTTSARINVDGLVTCKTGPGRMAVFTAKDDNTVGESLSTNGNPTFGAYGNPALYLNTWQSGYTANLSYLRISFAKVGLNYYTGTGHILSHSQLINCWDAINPYWATNILRNVLIGNSTNAFNSSASSLVRGEHLTLNQANALNYGGNATIYLTNSLIVAMPNSGYSGTSNQYASSGSGVFQSPSVGAGAHYLLDNIYRNQGTTNLNATLLKELKSLTTWPPLFYTNPVSSDTTLAPQASRDTDIPDLGYHYVPLDYLVSSLEVTNATLTLTNGVAVGVYGRYGLLLRNGARLVSEGTAVNLNRLTRYQTVQEQPVDLQNADWNALIHCETACATPPQVRLRFAEVSVMADSATKVFLFKNPYPIQPIELTDCQLHSVRVYLYPNQYNALGESLAVTNCLWNRVSTDLAEGVNTPITPFTVYFRNTTLRGGYISASLATNSPREWSFSDNFFAQSANWFTNGGGTWTNHHNGYTTGIVELPGEQDAQRYVTPQFVAGVLGGFYIPSSSSLTNHGSRTADAAGLYHYTTQTSNVRETNSVVDIGFHYVATDANGIPLDSDGDGAADYFEDKDGDGTRDNNETDGNNVDTDYDGRTDGQEYADGTDPLNPNSVQPARLFHLKFDNANWQAEGGQMPVATNNLQNVASFDGNALQIESANPAYLRYRDQETNGVPNINLRSGAIRFWFKPNWTGTNSGGNGPGGTVQLVSVGEYTDPPTTGWWSLLITNNGSTIALVSQTNGSATTLASGPIYLTNNYWYEITLAYNTNASLIHYYQRWVTNGAGMSVWPNATVRSNYGFTIGSAYNGTQQAKGMIDEFEIYNYPIGMEKGYVYPSYWNYPTNMYAQYEVDAALSATPLESSNAIRVEWRYDPSANPFLRRRVHGEANWTQLAANYKAWSYTDTNLTNGVIYEYQLNYEANRNILSGWNLPAIENRGRIILLIDQTLTNAIASNLDVLTKDLIGDGWKVTNYYSERHNDAVWSSNTNNIRLIKSFITNEYRLYSNDLKALFIIGHVPIPMSGAMSPDGHHVRPWPTDGYYADAFESSDWTDSLTNVCDYTTNIPGDGIFDQNNYPSALELIFGRIDYANMGALTNATEAQLINNYLVKNHHYRNGILQFSNVIYALGSFHNEITAKNVSLYRNAINISSKQEISSNPGVLEGNFFRNEKSAMWGCQSGSGNITYDVIDAFGPNGWSTYDMTGTANIFRTRFYLLLGSYFGEWHATNSFLRAVNAPLNSGLGSLWYANGTLWNLRNIGIGECMGEAVRDWINNSDSPRLADNIAFEWMGDPTLKNNLLEPPHNVALATNANQAVLSWGASINDLISYNIYRSTSGYSGSFTKLNNSAISTSTYIDNQPPPGQTIYMVRALKKIYTGCASYTNISQGVFITIP